MSEHTPGKWRVGEYGGVYPEGKGPCIVSADTPSGPLPNRAANEAYIVRAANAFPGLLEACEDLLVDVGVECLNSGEEKPLCPVSNEDGTERFYCSVCAARAAISAAREE